MDDGESRQALVNIDGSSGEAVYVQIARYLRERAMSGTWELGARLPSENELSAQFGVNRETIKNAYRVLVAEGLVLVRKGLGAYLVAVPVRRELELGHGDQVSARMPGPAERARLGLAPGIPVLVITRADGAQEVHGAAATIGRVACEGQPAASGPTPQ
jgi:DNA-binding GntR family transcriptional regulator